MQGQDGKPMSKAEESYYKDLYENFNAKYEKQKDSGKAKKAEFFYEEYKQGYKAAVKRNKTEFDAIWKANTKLKAFENFYLLMREIEPYKPKENERVERSRSKQPVKPEKASKLTEKAEPTSKKNPEGMVENKSTINREKSREMSQKVKSRGASKQSVRGQALDKRGTASSRNTSRQKLIKGNPGDTQMTKPSTPVQTKAENQPKQSPTTIEHKDVQGKNILKDTSMTKESTSARDHQSGNREQQVKQVVKPPVVTLTELTPEIEQEVDKLLAAYEQRLKKMTHISESFKREAETTNTDMKEIGASIEKSLTQLNENQNRIKLRIEEIEKRDVNEHIKEVSDNLKKTKGMMEEIKKSELFASSQ